MSSLTLVDGVSEVLFDGEFVFGLTVPPEDGALLAISATSLDVFREVLPIISAAS